jgi:uncharacterized protein YbaA (DUF1428 family)
MDLSRPMANRETYKEHAEAAAVANPVPFDGKRLIYGGFEVILEA